MLFLGFFKIGAILIESVFKVLQKAHISKLFFMIILRINLGILQFPQTARY
jgi:hypothetical protein